MKIIQIIFFLPITMALDICKYGLYGSKSYISKIISPIIATVTALTISIPMDCLAKVEPLQVYSNPRYHTRISYPQNWE